MRCRHGYLLPRRPDGWQRGALREQHRQRRLRVGHGSSRNRWDLGVAVDLVTQNAGGRATALRVRYRLRHQMHEVAGGGRPEACRACCYPRSHVARPRRGRHWPAGMAGGTRPSDGLLDWPAGARLCARRLRRARLARAEGGVSGGTRGDTRQERGVVSWVREFRRRHGRPPRIPEVQQAFNGLPKTTAWRKSKLS
jgi:hypothetical protein